MEKEYLESKRHTLDGVVCEIEQIVSSMQSSLFYHDVEMVEDRTMPNNRLTDKIERLQLVRDSLIIMQSIMESVS